jgi:hypothetical protein
VAPPAALSSAVLREGERRAPLRIKGWRFEVPIGDTSWSNDAIVEVAFAPPAGSEQTDPSSKASAP